MNMVIVNVKAGVVESRPFSVEELADIADIVATMSADSQAEDARRAPLRAAWADWKAATTAAAMKAALTPILRWLVQRSLGEAVD